MDQNSLRTNSCEYCLNERITFTRWRPWKKNDQCFVEQKNTHVVRRLVGYERFEGLAPARVLTELYKVIRLYVNFFQPPMRLLSKSRLGAKTHRLYDVARTPYDRVLSSEKIPKRVKRKLRREYRRLDPVDLLSKIERLQDELWSHAHKEIRMRSKRSNSTPNDLRAIRSISGDGAESYSGSGLLPQLKTAEEGERPKRTYRKSKRKRKKAKIHWWRSHPDAFEGDWDQIESWLDETPYLSETVVLERLQAAHPLKYPNNKLRTLQRRVKAWRLE